MLCERLEFTQLALVVAGFKFCEDGFVVRGGFGGIMPSALRAVIVTQVGLAIVRRLSGQAKNLSDAIFAFDLGSPDAASGTEAIFAEREFVI